MSEDLGVTVHVIAGRTALGRRLVMVGGVDVVLTVAGERHTEVVLEQAIELGVPALPIPHTGGDSQKVYELYPTGSRLRSHPGRWHGVSSCYRMRALGALHLSGPSSTSSGPLASGVAWFSLRTLNVHAVPEKELPDLIRGHLGEVKRRRNDLMLPPHIGSR